MADAGRCLFTNCLLEQGICHQPDDILFRASRCDKVFKCTAVRASCAVTASKLLVAQSFFSGRRPRARSMMSRRTVLIRSPLGRLNELWASTRPDELLVAIYLPLERERVFTHPFPSLLVLVAIPLRIPVNMGCANNIAMPSPMGLAIMPELPHTFIGKHSMEGRDPRYSCGSS